MVKMWLYDRLDSSSTNVHQRSIISIALIPFSICFRQGFYIAAQDQGACMSLVSMKVYYQFCPETVMNLSRFPATVAGGEVASLIQVEGQCVRNAIKVGNETELSK